MVSIERPEFVPDASLDRAAMEELQRSLAGEARWTNDLSFDPGVVTSATESDTVQSELGDAAAASRGAAADEAVGDADATEASDESPTDAPDAEPPVIAGVDQAFREDEAVSVVVATRGGEVIETVDATAPLEIPYVPGLLSFREGGAILAALQALSVEPDLLLVDGSGRIHYREAGLATHVGVTCDLPAVGVAKSLLCGEPVEDVDGRPVGSVVPIAADDQMTTEGGTIVGAAVQTRQYDSPNRYVNPLYVSPGHRVDWETAADLALAATAGYKLPEPIREADRRVGDLAASD